MPRCSYQVTVRGDLPSDITERISRAWATAVRHQHQQEPPTDAPTPPAARPPATPEPEADRSIRSLVEHSEAEPNDAV
jgi:hypothetical protein